MKLRYASSIVLLVCALVLWMQDLVALHLSSPGYFAIMGCAALLSMITAPTTKLRILGGIAASLAIFLLVSRASYYHRFNRDQKEYTDLVSSMILLRSSIDAYVDDHPEANSTNLADFVRAGALKTPDLAFIQRARVTVYSRSRVSTNFFMDVTCGRWRIVMLQDGTIFQQPH